MSDLEWRGRRIDLGGFLEAMKAQSEEVEFVGYRSRLPADLTLQADEPVIAEKAK